MALMRGMELQLAPGQPIVKLIDLDYKIGMMAHSFRTVFSFMLPEYIPGGRPREATLVAPEAMIMDMPKVGEIFYSLCASFRVKRCVSYRFDASFYLNKNSGSPQRYVLYGEIRIEYMLRGFGSSGNKLR